MCLGSNSSLYYFTIVQVFFFLSFFQQPISNFGVQKLVYLHLFWRDFDEEILCLKIWGDNNFNQNRRTYSYTEAELLLTMKKFCSTFCQWNQFVELSSGQISLDPTFRNTLGTKARVIKRRPWGKILSCIIRLLSNHGGDLTVIMRNRCAEPVHTAFSPLGVTCNYSCGALGRLADYKKELPRGCCASQVVGQPPSLS